MGFKLNACAGLAIALMLGGCATPVPQDEDFAAKLITEKAAIAAGAQRDYAALLAEDFSTVQKRWATFDTDTIDVDYIGDPKELVQSVASRYGMKFVENGKRLDLRPVNVRMKGVTPDALIRNLGNQMHAGADVILDRQAKMVIIEYKNRDAAEQNVQKGS